MKSETREYRTGDAEVVLDITDDCAGFVAGEGDGLLQVFVPHATAGIAVIETGAGLRRRPARGARRPAPGRRPLAAPARLARSRPLARDAGAVPPYATVPVLGGRLALGTWQSICLVDLNVDNPDRQVRFSFLAG